MNQDPNIILKYCVPSYYFCQESKVDIVVTITFYLFLFPCPEFSSKIRSVTTSVAPMFATVMTLSLCEVGISVI